MEIYADVEAALEAALGYLNFSAGASDPKFLTSLNALYRDVCTTAVDHGKSSRAGSPWNTLRGRLCQKLDDLESKSSAFADVSQARLVVAATHDQILPAYLAHHRELLFHQTDNSLFGPFFLGRCYEAALQCREAADNGEQLVELVLRQLNDYIGYRPIATLESKRKIEPYPHERCRPLPIYIHGAGAAYGPYEALVLKTIEILAATNPTLCDQAHFDLSRMEELAIDPRSYDFDHPVNKRPNYQFGQWDPHCIDNKGFYRRFIIQQVTIDALLCRVETNGEIDKNELLGEAAAALAGVILMSSGVSGWGPEAHSSDVTLSKLLPKIAAFRDDFYEELLEKNAGCEHLIEEARRLKQPYGGVRQDLNSRLSNARGSQLEHVHLARVFSRIGYSDASSRQAALVPTASARIICEIQCRITEGQFQLDVGDIAKTAQALPEISEMLHRGIGCGAIIDPWSMLGFDAQFSLFPSLENTVPDHRADELIELMDDIFALHARCWCLAAATGDPSTIESVAGSFDELASWWDQFAVTTISHVNGFEAAPLKAASQAAAQALAAWQDAGEKSGDVAFWSPFAAQFDSAKAYVLVLDALLDRHDYIASMALLMHWLSQADRVPLQKGSDWFHTVASRWLEQQLSPPHSANSITPSAGGDAADIDWPLVAKFFDYLEANADHYWSVPQLEPTLVLGPEAESEESAELDEDDEDNLYAAAYENVVYHDTTDDGIDSELLGDGIPETDDYALDYEVKRISDRLAFLLTVARLWKRTAQALVTIEPAEKSKPVADRIEGWLRQVLMNRGEMNALIRAVARQKVPLPSPSFASMVEYDRRRSVQESLLERIVASCVGCSEAALFLLTAGATTNEPPLDDDLIAFADMLRATLSGNVEVVREQLSAVQQALSQQSLLYVPLARGGDPVKLAATRTRQRGIRLLLAVLPRLGLVGETVELLEFCSEMEHNRPLGSGAVTEFDQLFKIGHQALVDCIVTSSESWSQRGDRSTADDDNGLIEHLQDLTEAMMQRWLRHSETLRLSVLEKVMKDKPWQRLVDFVKQFGDRLFEQAFFNLGNLRAILHQGVDDWLDEMAEIADEDEMPLLATIGDEHSRRKIVENLQLILSAIVENYTEYRDYNGTTTQSDRGEMLFTLLDMLRLRNRYDRLAWNMTPLVLTHEVLVRQRRSGVAEIWRQEMFSNTAEFADDLTAQLHELQRQYGMRLSTVADRIGERFVRPLLIDRICALVEPAMTEARTHVPAAAFAELEGLLDELTAEPTGVGLDVPVWLERLEVEVDRERQSYLQQLDILEEAALLIPQRVLSRHDSQEQLEAI